MLALGPPVGGHKAVEAPLVTEDSGEKVFVLGSTMTVDKVVRGHDCPGICFFHDDLEGFQVDLTDRTLGNAGVAVFPVGLLVVAGKMFHSGADLLRLDA